MSYITQRVEQELLRELLAGQDPPREAAHLRPTDFSNRLHQDLFTIYEQTREHTYAGAPDLPPDPYDVLTSPEQEPLYIRSPHDPPLAHDLSGHVRHVLDASFQRELVQLGERLATPEPAPEDRAALDDLISRHAAIRHDIDNPPPAVRAHTDTGPEDQPQTRERADLEDQLLADLLRNPNQAPELIRFLDSGTFTTPSRREIYEVIIGNAADGDPTDASTVAQRLDIQRSLANRYPNIDVQGVPDPEDQAPLTEVARLATTASTSTAIDIGRQLVAADIRTRLTDRLTETTPAIDPNVSRPRTDRPQPQTPQPTTAGPAPLTPPPHHQPAVRPQPTPAPRATR
jgi:replicative DNA helicase